MRSLDQEVGILSRELAELLSKHNNDWQVAIPLLSDYSKRVYKIISDGYQAELDDFDEIYKEFVMEVNSINRFKQP